MSKGYDAEKYPFGFGRTFFALDLKTNQVLWTHHEDHPVDTRAVAMTGDRIFYHSHPRFLACLDAKKGTPAWRTSDEKLLEAIGPHFKAQTWQWGFSRQLPDSAEDVWEMNTGLRAHPITVVAILISAAPALA